jgi:AcrR family transcriptional regulator
VAQVKKAVVRDAILAAAYKLFCEHGFNGSTLAQIAAEVGVSTANLYSYFNSKLDILYTIYDPWLRERLERLEAELRAIEDPHRRLRRMFQVLWRDIPIDGNCFANNIMQAISGVSPEERYDPSLLLWSEATVARMILDALPAGRRPEVDAAALAHMIFMTFDGFAISAHINPNASCTDAVIEQFCDLLLGTQRRAAAPVRLRQR